MTKFDSAELIPTFSRELITTQIWLSGSNNDPREII
jgi:hypothetical protein